MLHSLTRKLTTLVLPLAFSIASMPAAQAGLMLDPNAADGSLTNVEQPISHFDQVLLNAAWREVLDITLTGLLDGQHVYQHTIRLNQRGAVMFDFSE